MDQSKYAQAVISVQMGVKHEGRDCHVLMQDPKRPEGFSWVGGSFRPSGSFYTIVEDMIRYQTGAIPELETLKLKKVAYSRSAVNGRWLANYCFFVDARPVSGWTEPRNRDFRVALFDTLSFEKFPDAPPEKISDYYGVTDSGFRWAINDGGFIGRRVANRLRWKMQDGSDSMPDMPFVAIDLPRTSNLLPGLGLNVGSMIIAHSYKGERGRVLIENQDSSYYANIGGKVEISQNSRSDNIDVHSCIVAEGGEEIGVKLHGVSIVASSVTPLDLVMTERDVDLSSGDLTSVVNTCIRAAPVNPEQLDEAIENPQRFISEPHKIKRIHFVPDGEYECMLKEGLMRTRDMIPIARQEFSLPSARRPSLESVVVVPKGDYSAGFSKRVDGFETTSPC